MGNISDFTEEEFIEAILMIIVVLVGVVSE